MLHLLRAQRIAEQALHVVDQGLVFLENREQRAFPLPSFRLRIKSDRRNLGDEIARVVLAQLAGLQVDRAVEAVERKRVAVKIIYVSRQVGLCEFEHRIKALAPRACVRVTHERFAHLVTRLGRRFVVNAARYILRQCQHARHFVFRPALAVPHIPARLRYPDDDLAMLFDEPPRVADVIEAARSERRHRTIENCNRRRRCGDGLKIHRLDGNYFSHFKNHPLKFFGGWSRYKAETSFAAVGVMSKTEAAPLNSNSRRRARTLATNFAPPLPVSSTTSRFLMPRRCSRLSVARGHSLPGNPNAGMPWYQRVQQSDSPSTRTSRFARRASFKSQRPYAINGLPQGHLNLTRPARSSASVSAR